jgi:hypothetical protein
MGSVFKSKLYYNSGNRLTRSRDRFLDIFATREEFKVVHGLSMTSGNEPDLNREQIRIKIVTDRLMLSLKGMFIVTGKRKISPR